MKNKSFLFLQVFLIVFINTLKLNHNFWYIKYKDEIQNSQNPFHPKHWNYCDLKCLYLQNYYEYDFVIIEFRELAYRPDFAACYIKDSKQKNGYIIWDQKIQNQFYESICGLDPQDYLQTPDQYEVIKIEGVGRGNFLIGK